MRSIIQAMKDLEKEESDLADQIGRQVEAEATLSLDVQLVREYFNEVKARIRQANQDDVNILFRHLFAIKVDLETGEGQLSVLLGAEENDFVWRYRHRTPT